MEDMFDNPVMARARELRSRGAITEEFIVGEYMPEVLRLLEAGELKHDRCDEEGMHFVLVGKENHGN